ncbi:MAG TPA: hypothetical protein VFH54_06195, partial [Mycobacteriales bacterium]|nr:hypothetical protein [Mycobacteriales bacterium]
MANLIFPSESTRRIVSVAGAQTPILSTAGQTATVYSDSAGTTLASITTYPGNAVVTGSQLTLDAYGRLPFFYGPD